MLCTDIMMIQAASFIDSQLNHLFGTRSQANLTKDDAISTPNNKFNGAANFVQLNAQITQYFCSNTFTFAHKTEDRKSTRLNSSHSQISYAVFCLKKNKTPYIPTSLTIKHPNPLTINAFTTSLMPLR